VERKSSAARAAHRDQGRSYICCNVPNLLRHGRLPWCMSWVLQTGWQPWPHRHGHVATNVGATLVAMRRAGGARSHRRCIPCGQHLPALMRSLWKLACRR